MTEAVPPELPPLSPNAWLRWDVVASRLPPACPETRVLEVGCGQGGFGARLAQRYDYVGVELDHTSAAVASSRVRTASAGSGSVLHGDVSIVEGTFDLVCAFEVIEHIEDDRGALRDWASRLLPGGSLLLSTPAWQRRFGAADAMVGHFRRYDPPVMRALLQEAGLTDVELVHFGAPLGYVLEAGRNAVGRRRLAKQKLEGASMKDRTGASGRTLQPSRPIAARSAQVATLPFRVIQRAFPNSGPGLVACARKSV